MYVCMYNVCMHVGLYIGLHAYGKDIFTESWDWPILCACPKHHMRVILRISTPFSHMLFFQFIVRGVTANVECCHVLAAVVECSIQSM